uniref:SHSP domain-containing protein n=1 Tax=Panagrellus redivivus TaxID=6233 RepID=A0A7E4UWQ5_PANRE
MRSSRSNNRDREREEIAFDVAEFERTLPTVSIELKMSGERGSISTAVHGAPVHVSTCMSSTAKFDPKVSD